MTDQSDSNDNSFMYNTLAKKYLYKFCSVSPKRLCELARNDVTLQNYSRLPIIFNKLLLNDYLTYKNLPQILQSFKPIPYFPLSSQQINYLYQILNPHIHRLNDSQLFNSAIFLARTDPSFHQSKIFEYITRNYLKNKYQLLQLNLRFNSAMSIWKIIKHSISRILVMRYGSTNTPFTKDIEVPDQIKQDLLLEFDKNQYIRNTMVFQKLYSEIFYDVKYQFEQKLRENLYHHLGKQFFTLLAGMVQVWCIKNQLIDQRNQLIRELFLKMMLVFEDQQKLDEQNKNDLIDRIDKDKSHDFANNVQDVWIMHDFVRNNYEESEQKRQYLKATKRFIEKNYSNCIINHNNLKTFLDIVNDSEFQISKDQKFLRKITETILPIGYYNNQLFFKVIQTIKTCQYLKNQLTIHSDSIINKLTFSQLLSFPQADPANTSIAASIFRKILELQDFDLTEQNIINLLELLKNYRHAKNRNPIKNFMFKYISDHYHIWDEEMKEKVVGILEKFEDKDESFDQTGQYKQNIFQQIKRQKVQKKEETFIEEKEK